MAASTLTEEVSSTILSAVLDGCSMEDAAGAVGIHKATLYRWQKRGREAIAAREQGDAANPDDDPFVAFSEALETARFKSKVDAIRMWRKAILGWDYEETTVVEMPDGSTKTTTKKGHRFDYRAVVEWLERRYPKEFGRIIRQELSGPDGEPIPIEERARSLSAEVEKFLADQEVLGAPTEES